MTSAEDPGADAPSAVVTDPATLALAAEYEQLIARRVERHVAVDQPLVYVSQIQRCGGTLLSQLFDGHPELHAHPYEIMIGWPERKQDWPPLDLADGPERWWEMLHQPVGGRLFREGYTKYARKGRSFDDEELEVFAFLQPPELFRSVFVRLAVDEPPRTRREILDRYWTAYFNCWLDNQSLYVPGKRWVTGFTPRMMMHDRNVEAFFADYPDGRLVSIIREPVSWYVSAVNHLPVHYADPVASTAAWRASAEAMLRALDRYGADRVRLVAFEQLVGETERCMRDLAAWLGIRFAAALLEPTFNMRPIKADSSFVVRRTGILRDAIDRTGLADAQTATAVRAAAGSVRERVLSRLG